MLVTSLPDPEKFNYKGSGQSVNTIIYASSLEKYFYPRHETPYLFVTNYLNQGNYILNRQPIQISNQYFYFLNMGDELEIRFNKPCHLKTLLLLFNKLFIDDIIYFHTSSNEKLLDVPCNTADMHFQVPPVPFHSTRDIQQLLNCLIHADTSEDDRMNTLLYNLISEFLKINSETNKQIRNIQALKISTQQELYKRLFLARQFIADNVFENLKIDQIAKEVCLNKFHLLKTFKQLYQITPHQYLTEIRLEKAYQLLKSKRYTVGEVCKIVGFQSIASFSHLIKSKYRISPSVIIVGN